MPLRNSVRLSSITAMCVATILAACPVRAEKPNEAIKTEGAVALGPITPWNIDFGENRCRLTRFFGTEENRHLLMFEQAAPNSNFGMTLAGPNVGKLQSSRKLYVGMENGQDLEQKSRMARADIPNIGPAIILTSNSLSGDEDESALKASGIDLNKAENVERVVAKRGKYVLSFETGNMGPPFQALNSCTNDLLRAWGLEPEKHQSFSPAKWTNEKAITKRILRHYPSQALFAGEQAIFRMRVIVERDGTVSDCQMENSTEVKYLKEPACQSMLAARFDPARDSDGNVMRSFFATTVTYALN